MRTTKEILDRGRYRTSDREAVDMFLLDVQSALADGHNVELDRLGTLAPEQKDVGFGTPKRLQNNVTFRDGDELKRRINPNG